MKLVHFQPYDQGNGILLYDGVWETSSTTQTHIFSEAADHFTALFDKQVSDGNHLVQLNTAHGR